MSPGPRAPRPWWRRPRWWDAVGVAVVLAATALAWSLARSTTVALVTTVPVVVGAGGLGVLGAAAGWSLVRRRHHRALDRARQEAQDQALWRHQQFLRRLDHELKNPLTAIRAAVAGMEPATASGTEQRSRLDVIDAQARRMGRLLTDLRKLALLETAPLSLEEVNIAETVRDAVEAVLEEAPARQGVARLRLDLPQVPWPLPPVRGDGDLLYSAVYNLVSNAAKYTPSTGSIEVRGREEAGVVTVEVADTGIGIPDADLPGVFNELARASNARGLPGSGLGLALVSTIVRRHEGTVQVTSREGVGTRAWLSVPVAGSRHG